VVPGPSIISISLRIAAGAFCLASVAVDRPGGAAIAEGLAPLAQTGNGIAVVRALVGVAELGERELNDKSPSHLFGGLGEVKCCKFGHDTGLK
jgi:hypothetical protein